MLDVALRDALIELLEIHGRDAALGIFRLRRALRLAALVGIMVLGPALAQCTSLISCLTLAGRRELFLAARFAQCGLGLGWVGCLMLPRRQAQVGITRRENYWGLLYRVLGRTH